MSLYGEPTNMCNDCVLNKFAINKERKMFSNGIRYRIRIRFCAFLPPNMGNALERKPIVWQCFSAHIAIHVTEMEVTLAALQAHRFVQFVNNQWIHNLLAQGLSARRWLQT